ncbi:MAG: peptidylprolyl isomerase [Trichloromonadaceae bacterium]
MVRPFTKLILAVCAIGLCVQPALSASPPPTILAKVGGIPVTRYELQREVQKVLPLQVSFHGGISQEKITSIQKQAMDNLIERGLKLRYALDKEIAVESKQVDDGFNSIRGRYKTAKEFETALAGEGVADFRASIYRELLAKRVQDVVVNEPAQAKVTEQAVRSYYDKHVATFKRPKQFKASHILVKVDPASSAEERAKLEAKAQDLAAKAKAGEGFYNLAYYNSDDRSKFVGGSLGTFHEGQTVKEFEQALLAMKAGEISEPVKTMHGYHIIHLEEVNPPRQLTFDEVKEKIRAEQVEKAKEALAADWLQRLKGAYTVERFDQ